MNFKKFDICPKLSSTQQLYLSLLYNNFNVALPRRIPVGTTREGGSFLVVNPLMSKGGYSFVICTSLLTNTISYEGSHLTLWTCFWAEDRSGPTNTKPYNPYKITDQN